MKVGTHSYGKVAIDGDISSMISFTIRALTLAAFVSWFAVLATVPSHARGKAGQYDYLSLVLSWSPSYCAGAGRNKKELQCTGARPYAFVLHGLWPQYKRGFPEYCRVQFRPWVPKSVIEGMLDIMPSKKLVIHEYKKHGVCMGVDATKYYRASRLLFNAVSVPKKFQAPTQPFVTNVREIKQAFLKANPALKPTMLAVACGRKDRLKEVRICFDRKGKFTKCGANENQVRLCRANRIRVLAVRTGLERRPSGNARRDRGRQDRSGRVQQRDIRFTPNTNKAGSAQN